MSSLEKKRVVVLGGSSGIGFGVAKASAKAGANVVIASSRKDRVDEALTQLPRGAEGHALNLSDTSAIEQFFAKLGAFDHLVYTAGDPLRVGSLASLKVEDAQKHFGVRYWGAYAAAKFGSPLIRGGGSIVFTSGTAGRRPRPGWVLGASVCSAVEGMTRGLAVELAPIRVNLVCPGAVVTPLWDGLPNREAFMDMAAKALPVKHVADADEISGAYLYLMTQTFSTGEIVVVDGGGVLV